MNHIMGEMPDRLLLGSMWIDGGEEVVICNGVIRNPRGYESGVRLPEGSRIESYVEGSVGRVRLNVPSWWWWLHFGEVLRDPPPTECCHEAFGECPSREVCADCPLEMGEDIGP